jgi:WD40 repeat protein
MKRPLHQTIILGIAYAIAGFIFLGSLADTLSNAVSLITPPVTTAGSVLLAGAWLIAEILIRRRALPWIASGGQQVAIKSLGLKPRLALLGALVFLWIPRVFSNPAAGQQPNPTAAPIAGEPAPEDRPTHPTPPIDASAGDEDQEAAEAPTSPLPQLSLQNICLQGDTVWPDDEWKPVYGLEREEFGTFVAIFSMEGQPTFAFASRNGTLATRTSMAETVSTWPNAHSNVVSGLEFSPDGSFLYSASFDRRVRKWSISDGVIVRLEPTNPDAMPARVLSTDLAFPYMALALENGAIKTIDASDLSPVDYLPNAHLAQVWSLAFSPNNEYLVSGGADNTVFVWSFDAGHIKDRTALRSIIPSRGNGVVTSVAVADYGGQAVVAVAADPGYISIHSVASDSLNSHPLAVGSEIWATAFSPDGTILAVGTQSGTVHLFSTEDLINHQQSAPPAKSTRLEIASTFTNQDPTSRITSLAFSAAGDYLAIGYSKGISVWTVCPGKPGAED